MRKGIKKDGGEWSWFAIFGVWMCGERERERGLFFILLEGSMIEVLGSPFRYNNNIIRGSCSFFSFLKMAFSKIFLNL